MVLVAEEVEVTWAVDKELTELRLGSGRMIISNKKTK